MIYRKCTQEILESGKHQSWTRGRQGRTIKYIAVHHAVGRARSLFNYFNGPKRSASAHFYVTDKGVIQMLDTKDTAWTNSNWISNTESITIEVIGSWHYSRELDDIYNWTMDNKEVILLNLSCLFENLLEDYPDVKLIYHKDISGAKTLCPAELKDKGYALEAWNRAKSMITEKENMLKPKPLEIKPNKITKVKVTKDKVMSSNLSLVSMFGGGGVIANYLGVEPQVIIASIATISGSGQLSSMVTDVIRKLKGVTLLNKYPKQVFWLVSIGVSTYLANNLPFVEEIMGGDIVKYTTLAVLGIISGTISYRSKQNKG